MRVAPIMVLLFATGCSEWGLGALPDDLEQSLVADPPHLEFEPGPRGTTALLTFTLENLDERPVTIDGITVDVAHTELFRPPSWPYTLAAGDKLELSVSAERRELAQNGEILIAAATRRGAPPRVTVSGSTLMPDLRMLDVELGGGRIDCDTVVGRATVRNVGTALGRVSGVTAEKPWLTANLATAPYELAPGASVAIGLTARPKQAGEATSLLDVRTSEGTLTGLVSVEGFVGDFVTDRFYQDQARAGQPVELLIHIDRSPSMDDELEAVMADAALLLEPLSEVDWRAGVVIGEPNGCVLGGVVSTEEELVAALDRARAIPWAHHTEAPYQALPMEIVRTGARHCNEDLLIGGNLNLIVISDEADQSAFSWEVGLTEARGMRPDLMVHSIVGPPPRGCGNARVGEGHIEAAWATGGEVRSICEPFYRTLESVGEALQSDRRRWRLSREPVADSIDVEIDGVPTDAFTWHPEVRSVELWTAPPAGAQIDMTYQVDAPCFGR